MSSLLNAVISKNFLPSRSTDFFDSGSFEERMRNLESLYHLREYMVDFYEENQTAKDVYLKKWGFVTKDQLPLSAFALTSRVINRISMVYKRAPERRLVTADGTEDENATAGYNDLIKSVRFFNPLMKRAERYQKLLSNVVLRPEYDTEAQRYVLYIETAYIPQFGEFDTLYPVGYHFRRYGPVPGSQGKSIDHYIYIDDKQAFGHTGKPREMSDRFELEYAKGGTHDYGIMPVIDLSPPPVMDYWGLGARSLVDANRNMLVALLTTRYAHQFQSFDQPWVRNLEEQQLGRTPQGDAQLAVGTEKAWNLGEGEAGLLSPNPKLVESLEWMMGELNMVLSNYGVQASFREDGNPQSGFALLVKNLELLENRESDIDDVYREAEQTTYDVLAAMNKVHETGHNMPEGATVVADFADPEFPIEPAEERAQADWEIEKNLITPIDLMMQKNPDLDREQAKQRLEENQAVNNANRSTTSGLFDRFAARQVQNGQVDEENEG